MDILLKGYFDKNFGDDIMQLMLVRTLKEHNFYVTHPQREMLTHFEGIENVRITDSAPHTDAMVYVVGTGFKINGKRAVLERLISGGDKTACKKAAVIDCSIEPYDTKLGEYLARRDIKKYGLISCRDESSYEYLMRSFPSKNITMFPDVVFALENVPKPTGENALGIVPVRRMYSRDNYEYYKSLAETADEFADKTEQNVILFAFDTENENDTAAAYAVHNMAKRKDKITIISHNDNGANIINGFSRCSKIITSRFHGAVLALRCGIPVMAVADNLKLRILAKKYGFPICEKSNFKVYNAVKFLEKTDFNVSCVHDVSALGHFDALRKYLNQ